MAHLGYVQAVYLDGKFSTAIPLIIFVCLALAAGLTSLALPETLHRKLPETVIDTIQFGKLVRFARMCNKLSFYNL